MIITISIDIYWYKHGNETCAISLPKEMVEGLEKERKERYLETIPETVRVILSDYLRNKTKNKWLYLKFNNSNNIGRKQKRINLKIIDSVSQHEFRYILESLKKNW